MANNETQTPQVILHTLLETLHMNPRSFSIAIGQPYSKIYDIYRGRTKVITHAVAESICKKFNVRYNYILTGMGAIFADEETPNTDNTNDVMTNSFIRVIKGMNEEMLVLRQRIAELEKLNAELEKELSEYKG